MTLPVIDSLCRHYPDVEVTLLTSKAGGAIAKAVSARQNLHILTFNKKDYKGLSGLNRLYRELKAMHFDAMADLHDVLRTKWIDFRFRLSGLSVKVIDKGRKDKKQLVKHQIEEQLKCGVDRYHEVFEALGFDFAVDYDGHDQHEALKASAGDLATNVGGHSIGIAPFAQHQGKIYPVEMMHQVVKGLAQKCPDIKVFLFGGPEDVPALKPWAEELPQNVIMVAGQQTFAQDLALMARLKLMVSMDSANMHLASLVGLRCLSIWGATHIHAGFLGFGQREEDVISLPLPCRPCSIYGNKPCQFGDYRCMTGISPDMVVEKIIAAL